METTAVIIDHEYTFADALAIRLNTEEGLTAAAVAWPPATSVRYLAGISVGWQADVILLDADLAGAGQFCQAASDAPNAALIIMLSHTSEPARIVAAVEVGARAWVRKDESVKHLLRVLRGVVRGETWLPPAEAGDVLSMLLKQRDERKDAEQLLARLTPRERQVLACLAEGDGRNQIAERLNLRANTVRTHLQNIMAKLGVHSTLEAVVLTRAWLAPPDRH